MNQTNLFKDIDKCECEKVFRAKHSPTGMKYV